MTEETKTDEAAPKAEEKPKAKGRPKTPRVNGMTADEVRKRFGGRKREALLERLGEE